MIWSKKKYNIELISLHIPKTAGTSFFHTLQSVYGKKHVIRLDIRPDQTVLLNHKIYTKKVLPARTKVIHGHFLYSDLCRHFAIDTQIPVITWFRSPVERVISNYYYLIEILHSVARTTSQNRNIVHRMQKTLLEFASDENNQNRMCEFLEGLTISDLAFIGLVENYEEDLAVVAQQLNWKEYKTFHHNASFQDKEISLEDRAVILALNQLDATIYQEVKSKRG